MGPGLGREVQGRPLLKTTQGPEQTGAMESGDMLWVWAMGVLPPPALPCDVSPYPWQPSGRSQWLGAS